MNVNGTGPPTDWIPVETFDNDLDETHVSTSLFFFKPTCLTVRRNTSLTLFINFRCLISQLI